MEFVRASSLDEALDALARHGDKAKVLAGGTDLLVRMQDGLVEPECIVDVTVLDELRQIAPGQHGLGIGALVTHADLASSELVSEHVPALAEAARLVGSPQIRNRGTLGGNVVNASPAGDTIPPLFVHDAIVLLASAFGRRRVPIEQFFAGPGKTVMRPGELCLGFRIPQEAVGKQSAFLRLAPRKAVGIAKVSVAVAAWVGDGGRLTSVRVALGAVAPTVIRSKAAEAALEGQVASEEILALAGDGAMRDASPIDDIRSTATYRRVMCGVLLRRAVARLVDSGELRASA